MLKYILIILSPFLLYSPNDEVWSDFKTADISSEEKEVLYYINLVRTQPIFFKDSILNPFLAQRKNEYSKKYIYSLKRDLKKTTNCGLLKHHKDLYDFSLFHAKSTGKVGKVGHKSVWYKSYKKRSKKLLSIFDEVGENIHYGSNDPLEVVIEFLIDDGIKDLGHRKNILHPDFTHVSCAFAPHKKHKTNCVVEFGKQ